MTNDDDRVAYLAGEEGVQLDDSTRADLDELMALLGDDTVWAEPAGGLEDVIVGAIAAESRRPAAVPPPAARRTRRTRRWASVAVDRRSGRRRAGRRRVRDHQGGDDDAIEVALEGDGDFPDAAGSARLTQTDSGWRIELDAEGLPRLDDGRFYQAWLKNDDDVLVAVGTFNEADDVVLWAGVRPADFATLTVTEESADGDQASSGRRVLVGTIDAG